MKGSKQSLAGGNSMSKLMAAADSMSKASKDGGGSTISRSASKGLFRSQSKQTVRKASKLFMGLRKGSKFGATKTKHESVVMAERLNTVTGMSAGGHYHADAACTSLRIAPDNAAVAAAYADGVLRIFACTGERSALEVCHDKLPYGSFVVLRPTAQKSYSTRHPDADWYRSKARDPLYSEWSAADWTQRPPALLNLKWRPSGEAQTGFSQRLLAITDDVGGLSLWQVSPDELFKCGTAVDGGNEMTSLDFLPTGDKIVVAGKTGLVRRYDMADGNLVESCTLQGHAQRGRDACHAAQGRQRVTQLVCHPKDDNVVVTSSLDATVRVWDLRQEDAVRSFTGDQRGSPIDVSNEGAILVGVGSGLEIHDIGTGYTHLSTATHEYPGLERLGLPGEEGVHLPMDFVQFSTDPGNQLILTASAGHGTPGEAPCALAMRRPDFDELRIEQEQARMLRASKNRRASTNIVSKAQGGADLFGTTAYGGLPVVGHWAGPAQSRCQSFHANIRGAGVLCAYAHGGCVELASLPLDASILKAAAAEPAYVPRRSKDVARASKQQ